VVAPESLSKYDFGVRIAALFGFDPSLITPVRAQSLDRGAVRSLDLTLDPSKAQTALGHALPGVNAGLERFYQRWQEGYPLQLQSYHA
jgi:dTDP-4-dehydrorhamnose reductase